MLETMAEPIAEPPPPIPPCICTPEQAAVWCPRWRRPIPGAFYETCRNTCLGCYIPGKRESLIRNWGWEAEAAERKAAAQFETPGFFAKVGHLARAMGGWAKERFRVTTEAGMAERRAICNPCEHRDPIKDECKLCGCHLSGLILNKLRVATEACPVGKWGPEPETPESKVEDLPDDADLRIAAPDLRGATMPPRVPGLFTADMRPVLLTGHFRGTDAWILGRGPSLRHMDLSFLKEPGRLTIGLNNVTDIFPYPTIWLCQDDPEQFPGAHWANFQTFKLLPGEWADRHVMGKPAREYPSTYFYVRNFRFRAPYFVHEPTWTVGCIDATVDRDGKVHPPSYDDAGVHSARSILFPALKACLLFGISRAYLLGVDWLMPLSGAPYADNAGKDDFGRVRNNEAYIINGARLERLRPHLAAAGLMVYNATPGSALEAFPKIDYRAVAGPTGTAAAAWL
jgi:hypothetical protein